MIAKLARKGKFNKGISYKISKWFCRAILITADIRTNRIQHINAAIEKAMQDKSYAGNHYLGFEFLMSRAKQM